MSLSLSLIIIYLSHISVATDIGHKHEVHKIKRALQSAEKLFSDLTPEQRKAASLSKHEEIDLIHHNIQFYDRLCPGIELFGHDAEEECSKYEDEMTEYIKNVSKIPMPPRDHTIQFYWAEPEIWRKLETNFVCLLSDHFKKLFECLCSYCKWPFVVVDDKYPVYSVWKKEYDSRNCEKEKTHKPFMKVGDDICQWLS